MDHERNDVLWIGLTGGIASGKSEVASILREMGHSVLDADVFARQALDPGTPGYQQVVDHFGKKILNPDGSVNRRKLGEIIFSSPKDKKILEEIVHPIVRKKTEEARASLKQQGKAFAFYEIPLLFEKAMEKNFDFIALVFTSEKLQKDRMKQRNGFNESEVDSRLKSQIPLQKKRAASHFIIENDKSLEHLRSQVDAMLKTIEAKIK